MFQIVGDISQRLGHFLWKGMKPFPALGTLFAKAAQGIQVFATFAAWREKISREEGSRMLFILSQRRGEHKEMYDKSCRILNNHI